MNRSVNNWDSCVEAGRQAYEKGCYVEADQILSRTMERFSTNAYQTDMLFVDLLIVYARVKRERCQFADAVSLYYRALSTLHMKAKKEKALIGRILQELALCHCLAGSFKQAKEKETRALVILDEIFGFDSQVADESVVRLACLSWILNDMDSASVYLERHLRHCIKQQNSKGQALVAPASMLAQAFYRIGNYSLAEKWFRESRGFFQEPDKLAKELSIIDNELGMAICAQGRCEEARVFCQEAAALRAQCSSRGERIDRAEAINDIADFYCSKDDFNSAKQLCESAESSRWDVPEGSLAGKLMLFSRLLARLGQSEESRRLERRVRELDKTA